MRVGYDRKAKVPADEEFADFDPPFGTSILSSCSSPPCANASSNEGYPKHDRADFFLLLIQVPGGIYRVEGSDQKVSEQNLFSHLV